MLKPYFFVCYLIFLATSVDSFAQRLWWGEDNAHTIRNSNLNGGGLTTYYTDPSFFFREVHVDEINDKIVFGSGATSIQRLDRATASGLFEILGDLTPAYYNSIEINKNEALVYLTYGEGGIVTLGYDGTDYGHWPLTTPFDISGVTFTAIAVHYGNEELFFTDGVSLYKTGYSADTWEEINTGSIGHSPTYIALEETTNKIYWINVNGFNYEIMESNLDGSGTRLVKDTGTGEITSLDVYGPTAQLFFTKNYNQIRKVNIDGSGETVVYTGGSLYTVTIEPDAAPIFTALNPIAGSSNNNVASNLTLTFNENVVISATTGTPLETSFRIYETIGDVLKETIDASSANISISGNTVTINPTAFLDYSTAYYVLAGNKVISDLSGNNWVGISLPAGWGFTTESDQSQFYSRQNGDWDDPNTWSHISHTGPAATNSPGTGADVIIGNGNTVTLSSYTGVVAKSVGTWIQNGATLDAALNEFHVWGPLRIDGQLLNATILSGTFDLYASGGIPIFQEINYGVVGLPGAPSQLFTNVIAIDGVQSVDGGTLNMNGFEICTPPMPPPSFPVFSNKTNNSVTLSWTSGGGNTLVVARQAGASTFKPLFGSAYTANAAFGSGSQLGTGNYVVYSGTGTSVTITGLSTSTAYEFDLYSFNTTIGGCYNVLNYQPATATSCILIPAPANPIDGQYCAGGVKPAINVSSPGSGRNIRWYDAATGGSMVPGNVSGGDGRGGVFIPAAPSGTFYAETYDGTLQCSSSARTAVTLTQDPALSAGTPSADQSVCTGGDPAIIDGGTAAGGTGVYTYYWESAAAAGGPYSAITSAIQPTYDPPAGITQTTYYHRVTRSANCLQPGNPVAVTIVAPPSITVQPTPQQACDGKSATFSIDATGAPLTSQWQVDNGSGFSNITNGGIYSGADTKQLQISNVTGLNGFRYQCIVSIGSSCPVTSSAAPLTVVPNPVVTNQSQTVCEGTAGTGIATVNLTALNPAITGGTAGFKISWYTNVGLTNPVADPSNATANNNTVFYAGVTNANGCTSGATASILVNKKPAGTGIISGPLTLCTNNPATFTITNISNAISYNWQVSSELQVLSQTGTTASLQAISPTTGTITVTGENSCGTGGSAVRSLQILSSPTISIVAPSEIIVGEPASFLYESTSPLQTVLWNFGDNESSGENAPQHLYSSAGSYTVSLEVSDPLNCESSDEITLVVVPIPELRETSIKNVITANGDSENGLLYIENLEKYPSNQVVLLDRWGVEVFKKENYENDWDARRNGDFLPAGQYVCVVKLNETGKIYSRTVSVIKRK